jgi:hypothetical protein
VVLDDPLEKLAKVNVWIALLLGQHWGPDEKDRIYREKR